MVEIIPAILTNTRKDLENKIRLVEPYVNWVQIDVSDGTFTPNITWNNPAELKGERFSVALEAHLMVTNPIQEIPRWAVRGVKRVIVHREALSDTREVALAINKARDAGLQIGLALNPETPPEQVEEFVLDVDVILILAVAPGFGGQQFNPAVLNKVKVLRQKFPDANIEVDGGINLDTARACVEAGANILVVGSYIFGSTTDSTKTPQNVTKAIEELKAVRSS